MNFLRATSAILKMIPIYCALQTEKHNCCTTLTCVRNIFK